MSMSFNIIILKMKDLDATLQVQMERSQERILESLIFHWIPWYI